MTDPERGARRERKKELAVTLIGRALAILLGALLIGAVLSAIFRRDHGVPSSASVTNATAPPAVQGPVARR